MPAADPREPFSDTELDALFARLEPVSRLALAVSGGADSIALLLLLTRWRRRRAAPDLLVLTVDHGLRPESALEAALVGRLAAERGLAFRGLRWDGPHPDADIEGAARAARYKLLIDAAHEAGASHLVTAHHRDDQAETFLMRLARGSGVYGLAAMRPEVERGGITIARPLLGVSRTRLAAVTAAAGITPVDDPHNHDPRFARARIRALAPLLAHEGLDAERLAATAARLGRAAAALDGYVDGLLARAAVVDLCGAVRLERAPFRAEPEEVRLRTLGRILRAVGGAGYPPRLERLEALEAALGAGEGSARRTLAGVVVDQKARAVRFQREAGRDGLPRIAVGGRFDGVWDGRFRVSAVAGRRPLVLAALGEAGRREVAAGLPDGLPHAIAALPAIWSGERLVAVPSLGFDASAAEEGPFGAECLVPRRLAEPARFDDR